MEMKQIITEKLIMQQITKKDISQNLSLIIKMVTKISAFLTMP